MEKIISNITIILLVAVVLLLVVLIVMVLKSVKNSGRTEQLARELEDFKGDVRDYMDKNQKDTLDFLQRQQESATRHNQQIADMDTLRFKDFSDRTNDSINTLRRTVGEMSATMDKRFETFQKQNSDQLSQISDTMEKRVSDMQTGNEKKLEEMRQTVDEKLQKTLEERISQSFKMVSDRLDQVYTSLGEMQKVGAGVDDLKRVLSNVKTRGILGEVQLGAILEEILSPEQYETNVITKKGSADRVEFAVKLPGADDGFVYLPIDAKFPLDAYSKLLDAYDSGDAKQVEEAVKDLRNRIKGFAKDIRTKYIDVPHTTEFAIMFLPTEGLYAEVVRHGMVEELQKERINIAGPTTMAALLNSLQMGFKTLAIQKSSNQVWTVLQEVKTEFGKFGDVLAKTQDRMRLAQEELEKLVGTRTNAINRKLRDVSEYSVQSPENLEKISQKSVDNTTIL